eukprot:CAMPEP_0194029936 /NCGR_PEP_ID=MMETSP0009_2-20130614/3559_1 /TAXON_ID=210454 /ORGANISM="Grammatophora oceanica, Strain CCMP 410" /LENGTH=243 /DNA_ID=CAMNT_0038669761 /DNA_START=112 /DNA_END=840 /DNA_ORIENTATION=-
MIQQSTTTRTMFDGSNFMVVRQKQEALESDNRSPSPPKPTNTAAKPSEAFDPFALVEDTPNPPQLPQHEEASDDETVSDIDDDCTLGAKGALTDGIKVTKSEKALDPSIVERMEDLLGEALPKKSLKKLTREKNKDKKKSKRKEGKKSSKRNENECVSLEGDLLRSDKLETSSRTSGSVKTAPTVLGSTSTSSRASGNRRASLQHVPPSFGQSFFNQDLDKPEPMAPVIDSSGFPVPGSQEAW